MNVLPKPLPALHNPDSSMWVDEAIWGHRLHDEQSPWLVILEFLNVFSCEDDKNRALVEVGGFNTLNYQPAKRMYLRNILFNNPKINEINTVLSDDGDKWEEWLKEMQQTAIAINTPDYNYLKKHFNSFSDFAEIVSIVRSSSLEINSNKRWTSKFVFPYGKDCLYEDLDNRAGSNDRRFFGRTGEVLYLMLSRSHRKDELKSVLKRKIFQQESIWNSVVKCLQPSDPEVPTAERGKSFLPYENHPSFDELTEDWLAILNLNFPGFDAIPHIVNLTGLHLLKYQLITSKQLLNQEDPFKIICEAVAPKKTLVRDASSANYQENNLLSTRAVEYYVSKIEQSDDWQQALSGHNPFVACRKILEEKVLWGDDYVGPNDPEALIKDFRTAALRRHRQHVANIHRNYGREIGLVSKRGTVKLRYAPTDALLKSLIFSNIDHRLELHQFLSKIYARYGLIFGDKEAEQVLVKDEFDKKTFQLNSQRLEQRLGSLGLLKRLSDGCAYIINPYSRRCDDK